MEYKTPIKRIGFLLEDPNIVSDNLMGSDYELISVKGKSSFCIDLYECNLDLDGMLKELLEKKIDKIIAVSDFGMLALSVIAPLINFKGPSVKSVYYMNNKYYTRKILKEEYPWYVGITLKESDEELLAKVTKYPCFLKPTISSAGLEATKIISPEDLLEMINIYNKSPFIKNHEKLLDKISKYYDIRKDLPEYPDIPLFIVEEFIEHDKYCCCELFVDKDGNIQNYSIYPSNVGDEKDKENCTFFFPFTDEERLISEKLFPICRDIIKEKFVPLGFVNNPVHFDFAINQMKTFTILEINSRTTGNMFESFNMPGGTNSIKNICDLIYDKHDYVTPIEADKMFKQKIVRGTTILNPRFPASFEETINVDYLDELESNPKYKVKIFTDEYDEDDFSEETGLTIGTISFCSDSRENYMKEMSKISKKLYLTKE